MESHLPAIVRRNFLLTEWKVVCEKMGSLGHVNTNAIMMEVLEIDILSLVQWIYISETAKSLITNVHRSPI